MPDSRKAVSEQPSSRPRVQYAAATWALALWAVLGSSAPARAGYLESDYEKAPEVAQRLRPIPRPRPRLNPVAHLVRGIRIRPGHYYRGLMIFPLEYSGAGVGGKFVTMSEALAAGHLTISEKGGGNVPELRFHNRSERHVFMLSGEMVTGGKQNRTLRQDVLLGPHSETIVPVYCIEERRWSEKSSGFDAQHKRLSSASVRAHAQARAPQPKIWSEVKGLSDRLNVKSPTRDLDSVYKDSETGARLRRYSGEFLKILPRPIVGIVAARRGRIVGADIFTDPSLFSRFRQRIIESYALDALSREEARFHLDAREVRRFLERTYRSEYQQASTPGQGRAGRLWGSGIRGDALLFDGRIVHAALFPQIVDPIVRPMRGEQPRER